SVNNQSSQARHFKFKLVIKDGNKVIATLKPLESINPLSPGMNALSAASFRADSGAIQSMSTYDKDFWEKELEKFQDNPSEAKGLLTKNFRICLVPLDDNGYDIQNNQDEPQS